MATTPPPPPPPRPYEAIAEEEYIDMDVSNATLVWYSTVPSPPHLRDFEFQMTSSAKTTLPGIVSPADELFYKGKLLPLHLPPRLQLVQKLLLQDSTPSTHFASATTTAAATPYESCNVSPAASCYVSGELNPEDYYLDDDDNGDERGREELAQLRSTSTKKSWTRKLKQSSLSLKLKASRAYLKSLFTKSSGCSEEPRAVPAKADKKSASSRGDAKRASGALRRRVDAEKMVVEEGCGHRRSFSGAIKRRVAPNKSSSSSSSSTSSTTSCSSSNSSSFSSVNSTGGPYGPQALKRSSSVNSEVECSVQGAIAYCKKSQQEVLCSRKSVSDVEFYALSASRIAADCEKLERPEICRG